MDNNQENKVEEKDETSLLIDRINKDEITEQDTQVYNVIKSNAKLFMAEFAKVQMKNMVENSKRLDKLQTNLMSKLATEIDSDKIIRGIDVIRKCQETNINLINKISNDTAESNIIYNDNRQVNNNTTNTTNIELSNQSKEKLRNISNQIIEMLKLENTNQDNT